MMESTSLCESQAAAKNNNDNLAVSHTVERVAQGQKEREMETNCQWQNYFSSFSKELLWPSTKGVVCEITLPGGVSLPLTVGQLIPEKIIANNNRSKCSVTELVHTIVTLTLGKKSVELCLDKYLFAAILNIGCDAKEEFSIRSLLHKLVAQMIKYISSKSMSDTLIAMQFLEVLFSCINENSNFIIKDYVSICIKEFLQNLLNLLPKQDRQNSFIYHYTIHKVINLALYPSCNEPLTAAFVFNHLHDLCISPHLNMIVPNKYWLEFLHSFLMNLDKCSEKQVFIALESIKNTICARTSIFNAKFPSRRKPSEFSNEKLEGAVIWLFEQCGNTNNLLRDNCVKLFEELCVHVSNIKCTGDFVHKYGAKNVNKIALDGLDYFEDIDVDNLKALARALDFYAWIFGSNMSTPELVFDKNEKNQVFLNIFESFVSILVKNNIDDTIKASAACQEDAQEMLKIVSNTVVCIFPFISAVLMSDIVRNSIIKKLWNDNLCLVISRFTLCPQKFGCSEESLKMLKPQFLKEFFGIVSEHLPSAYLRKFHINFFADAQEELQNFANVQYIMASKTNLSSLKFFLNGITLLKSCEFINFEKELKFTTAFAKEKITGIFESLKSVLVDHNSIESIDSNVIDYLKAVLNFFLLSYEQELAEFMIKLISGAYSSTNGTAATVFFKNFEQPILHFFMKNPTDTLNNLNTSLLSSPEKFLLLLQSLLTYATKNPSENSKVLAESLIKDCNSYRDLILDVQYHDWLFKINRLAVSLSSNPAECNGDSQNPLISYVMDEFEKAENVIKRIEIVDGFIRCFTDGSRDSKSHIATIFKKLKDERLEAPQQLNSLIEKLAAMKSWPVWEGIILLTCGACECISKHVNFVKYLAVYFIGLSWEESYNRIEKIQAIFRDTRLSPDERLDVLCYFLLPSIEYCQHRLAIHKFYEVNFQDLYDMMTEEMNDTDNPSRKHDFVNKIGSNRLFEIMYGKLSFSDILNFRMEHPGCENPEYLNIFLLKYSHEMRAFSAKSNEEKELTRLLHCSALNTYIAMVNLQVEKAFQNFIFKEERPENQLVWEKIIDCNRRYYLTSSSSQVRVINLLNRNGERMRITLEKDELNDHECMPMIVGILLNMYDNKSTQTRDTIPDWMAHFHEAFNIEEDNVKLYLLKVVVNARRAFIPYIQLLLESIAKSIISYLCANKINYVIRDILMIILETECELKSESETQAGQKLIESLMERAQDPNISVCTYNVELIEKLIVLWKTKLQVPENLDNLIESDQTLAIQIVYVLLKQDFQRQKIAYNNNVQAMVRNRMYRWREPLTPQVIEILGYMVSCIPEQDRDRTIKKSLLPLFKEMRRAGSADFCAHMFYLIFNACPSLAKHEDLSKFINPIDVKTAEYKAECFEMFFETMTNLEPSDLHSKLESMKFIELLQDETILPCVEMVFKNIDKLVLAFNAEQLLPYARVVQNYAKKDALLEHKSNAIWFFIGIYKKYMNDAFEECDEHTKNLLKLSEYVLINGVSDPLDEMQEEVLDFWRDNTKLTENTVDRLKRILDMFSLEVHSSYAQFFCLLMLDLTNKYSDNQKLLFAPLTPCNYEVQEVIVPRKSRSKTPVTGVQRPIQKQPQTPTNIDDGNRQKVDNIDVKLSRRTFPSNDETDVRAFLYLPASQNYAEKYAEKLKAQKLEQDNTIKFNRTYKDSYLPDVEINQADLVATIEDYAKRCPTYAANMSVSIVCGLLNHFKDTDTHAEILQSLSKMCKKALKEPNDFAPVALEILYKSDCKFDVNDVFTIAMSMDLQSSGILILEKESVKYNYEDLYRSGKKMNKEVAPNRSIHLATLYRSIDEIDVVNSIAKNWTINTANGFLSEGSAAEADMDWSTAKDVYEEGFKSSTGIVKDYCMEGMFECLSKLSSWSEINETIETILQDKDHNSVWQHPNEDQLLPWMFKAQLQEKLESLICDRESNSEFSKNLEAWVNSKGDAITKTFGEELSVFFLCEGDSSTARKCLESCLSNMRKKWTLEDSNQRVVAKFQRLWEIEMYMKAIEKDPLDGAQELLSFWEKNVPAHYDDLLNWNFKLSYRLAFANLMSNWLQDVSMNSGVVSDLTEASLKQQLFVNDLALRCKNTVVARKRSLQIKKTISALESDNEDLQHLKHQFKLATCRYAFLQHENESVLEKRFNYFITSWNAACNIYQSENIRDSIKIKSYYHIFELTQAFRSWLLTNDVVALRAIDDEFVGEELKAEVPEDLDSVLFNYSFNTLKDACDDGSEKDRAESYTKFAVYCQKLIIDVYDRDDCLKKEFIFSLLTAMSFGSTKAARYFPCLLKHSIYRDNERLARIFMDRCSAIPSRMFLDWQNEIISHLATPLAPKIIPIVEKLCNDYPSLIMLNLRKVRANPSAEELYNSTFADQKYDTFFSAMSYLCQPEEYLRHYLQEFLYSKIDLEILSETIESMVSKDTNNTALQSPVFKKILTNHKKDLEKLANMSDIAVAKKAAKQLSASLQKSMAQRIEKEELTELTKLSYYSPFLNDFTEKNFDVDVPVRHNSLRQRPKIVRIDRFVRVLPTKRSSLMIKIVGNDGKTYEFVVKCGLDLHQDQKMQQIFRMTNHILKDDYNCCSRHLKVNENNVIPISNSTCLIEWIPHSKSLEEVIDLSLTNKSAIQIAKENHLNWINAASEDETLSEGLLYKKALVKYTPENVSNKMIELSADIRPNLLQQSIIKISPSLDSFFKLRQKFIKSYATMCLIHWLFGVGDRRLKNILIDIFNGDCFSINFNLILGAAAELPIPELVPFRLTAQIINFMKPLKEQDLLSSIMCHVLKALENNSSLMIGCLEAFIEEPIDWNSKLNFLWKKEDATHKGIEWFPMKKIEIFKKKLRGTKPSKILIEELSCVDSHIECIPVYSLIVNGNERFHTTTRSLKKDHELTPEEQVLCLLDQATDVNTIGRMCAQWKSFL